MFNDFTKTGVLTAYGELEDGRSNRNLQMYIIRVLFCPKTEFTLCNCIET